MCLGEICVVVVSIGKCRSAWYVEKAGYAWKRFAVQYQAVVPVPGKAHKIAGKIALSPALTRPNKAEEVH